MKVPLLVAAIGVAAVVYPAAAQTDASASSPGSVTLYELPAYLGRSVTVTSANPDLAKQSFAKRAQSARVTGEWTVCGEANYKGGCTTLSSDQPVIRKATVASLRPATTAATSNTGTTGQTGTSAQAGAAVDLDSLDADAGTEGQDVAFFARPSLSGTGVSAGSNDRASADSFCKLAGYTGSAYSSRARTQATGLLDLTSRTKVRAFALRDVLCRR